MIQIGIADYADAQELSLIAEKIFRDTFSVFNTKEDMDEYCKKSYSKEIQQNELADKSKCTFLCKSDNKIIGYAQINWNNRFDGIQDKSQAEIQRFYILKDWHGAGIAQNLMNTILDSIRQQNIKHVWLGVWEKNERAKRFYKRFGFTEIGEHIFFLGKDAQRDVILHKVLEPV